MKRIVTIWIGWLLCASTAFAQGDDMGKVMKDSIFHYYDLSEFDEVVRCGHKALAIYEASGDHFEMAGCLNVLGNAYQRLGRYKEAIESYERCAEEMERLMASNDEKEQAHAARFYERNIRYTRNNMAKIFLAIGEYDQAENLYQQCIEMVGKPTDTIDFQDIATYKQNLSEVYSIRAESKDGAEKDRLLGLSVALAEEANALSASYDNQPFKRLSKKLRLAQAYHAVGRNGEAMRIGREVLESAEAANEPYHMAEAHIVMAKCDMGQGNYTSAESHYRKAMALATDNHYDELQLIVLKGAYTASKHFDKALALDYFEHYTDLKDSVFDDRQQQLLREYQAKYELNDKERQLELEKASNRRNRLTIIALIVISLLVFALLILMAIVGRFRKRNQEMTDKINLAKDQLFTIVSHDFKTAMVSQNLMLDVLNGHYDEMDDDDIKGQLQQLKNSSDTLKNNMASLIEWVKMELGGDMSTTTTFNLRTVVDGCIKSQEAERLKKQLTVANAIDPTLKVCDNENMVKLITRNLVNNAMKHSHAGGEITVEAREEGKHVWLIVTDHGEGFPQQFLDAFHNGRIQSSGELGSGIGLMLSKQVIERSGGQLTIESKKDEGATVRFTIRR